MLRFYLTLEMFSPLCFIRILNHILYEEIYFHGLSSSVYQSVPYGLLHDHSHYKNTWMLRVKILCGSWEFREKETKAHIDHRNAWEPHAWIACWRRVVLCPHLVFSFMSKTFVSSKRWLQFKLVVTFVTSKYYQLHEVSKQVYSPFFLYKCRWLFSSEHDTQESLLPAELVVFLYMHCPHVTP